MWLCCNVPHLKNIIMADVSVNTTPDSIPGEQFATAVVDGVLGLGQDIVNNNYARKEAKRQYERQKEFARLQFNQQKEFWKMQNEYNTPKQQRSRFNEAGLNPAAAVGQIASGGTAQGLSSVNGNPVPGNEYAQQGVLRLEGLASVLETVSRIESLGADTGLKNNQMITEALKQALLGIGIEKDQVDLAIKHFENKTAEKRYLRIDEFLDAELQRIISQGNESQANADSTTSKLPFEIEKITSEISLNQMTTILRDAQTEEAKAAAANQYSQARLNNINADLTAKYGDAKAAADLKDAQTKADYCSALMQSALDLQASTIMLNQNQALTNESRVLIEQQAQQLNERYYQLESDKFSLEQNKFELEAVKTGINTVLSIINTATPW